MTIPIAQYRGLDTSPTMSTVVADATHAATLVLTAARLTVFDTVVVTETCGSIAFASGDSGVFTLSRYCPP